MICHRLKRADFMPLVLSARRCLRRGSGIAVLLSAVLAPLAPMAKAEGSRDMFPSGAPGNRGHIEWRSNFTTSFRRRTLFRVFASQGEYILLGASSVGVGQGDIEIFHPGTVTGQVANESLPGTADFTCSVVQPGRGFIANRAQELAGPASIDGTGNVGGYQPCYYEAPATGIYYVAMYGPSGNNSGASPNAGVEHNIEAINTNANQATGISAWDVTVRSSLSATTDIEGRLHTFHLAFNMGQNEVNLHSSLYPVTVDGFRYRIDLNGVDPFGFSIFGNQFGNLDSDGMTPLYRNVLGTTGSMRNTVGNTRAAPPQYPLFINEIDPVVLPFLPVYDPLLGTQTSTGFPALALLPQVLDPAFAGNISGNTSSVGAGGTFSFVSNLLSGTYEIVISRDGVNYDPDHPDNDVLRGVMTAPGQQFVTWDGFDNSGRPVPSGTFTFEITARGGEYHFPMSDVENNPLGGPIYNLLNAENPRGNTVGFYDHRGYYTLDGTLVSDRDPSDGDPTDDAMCGQNPPSPPSADFVLGSDSAAPGFNMFGLTTGSGNTNTQCTGAFGDTKIIDLWTYFPSLPPLEIPLIIISPTDFGDAPDRQVGDTLGDYSTLAEHNGPWHDIALGQVFLGDGVSDDTNGFADGVDNLGAARDDDDDAFASLPTLVPERVYALNNIPVNNGATADATLHGWIDFNRNGVFEADEYQSAAVAPGKTTTSLSWLVPASAIPGITYVRFRLSTDALADDASTVSIDERSVGKALDGEVEDYQSEIKRAGDSPHVLLVKRITAIMGDRTTNPNDGTVLNQFVDNTDVQATEDNHPNWPSGYLLGALDGGYVRSVSERAADNVEYTLYFLSVGSAAARDVLLCDRIPPNTQFAPDAYAGVLPTDPAASPASPLGIALDFGGTEFALTGAADGDAGYYFPPGVEPTTQFPSISCNGPNINGSVVVDLDLLPPATAAGSPSDAYGALRFQVQVQ